MQCNVRGFRDYAVLKDRISGSDNKLEEKTPRDLVLTLQTPSRPAFAIAVVRQAKGGVS